MDDKYEQLEAKIDHLQECMYTLMRFIEEQSKGEFERDFSANVAADIYFETVLKGGTFFDG